MDKVIKEILQYKNKIDEIIESGYHSLAQKHGLTLEQFNLMVELDELKIDVLDPENAPTVGDMAKTLKSSQNTMSERISRMEAKDLVMRVKDPKDRRISRIMLTEHGNKVLQEISEEVTMSVIINALSSLTDEESSQLHDTLYKLQEFLIRESKNS